MGGTQAAGAVSGAAASSAASAPHVLVTGGGGFLGRALVQHLLAAGHTVRSFARGAYPELEALGVEVLSARIDRADASDPAMISGQDLVEALSWHGISSRAVYQTPLANESAGAAILRDVAGLDVSLVVMGAFTQSRVRGVSLGDVTKYMIRHATVPLLMTGS